MFRCLFHWICFEITGNPFNSLWSVVKTRKNPSKTMNPVGVAFNQSLIVVAGKDRWPTAQAPLRPLPHAQRRRESGLFRVVSPMEAPFWRAKGWETDAYKNDHRGFHHSNLELCFRFLFIYVYCLQTFWFLIAITMFMIVCSNLVLFLLFWVYIPWLFDSQFFFPFGQGISIPVFDNLWIPGRFGQWK